MTTIGQYGAPFDGAAFSRLGVVGAVSLQREEHVTIREISLRSINEGSNRM
jgi:hypothetical protein